MRNLSFSQILTEVYGCPRLLEVLTLTAGSTSYRSSAIPANSRLLVIPSNNVYMKIGDSTVTVATTTYAGGGIYLATNEKYSFCLRGSETNLAFNNVNAGTLVCIFLLEPSTDGLPSSNALEAQYGRPRPLEVVYMSAAGTSYRSSALTPGSRVMVQCGTSFYVKAGDSTVSMSGATHANGGVYVASLEKYIFCLSAGNTHLALVTANPSYARIYVME